MTEQEYQQRIAELEREVSKLQTEVRKNSETKYGLRWMDVPEAFDSEDRIPILEEVKERAISNHDGQPTHILIEGDNYHALTCLNYTHKGKIDVIYIDPPYNTGSDGFVYKDKRVLETFPDGQPVPVDHPLRHSYWLSFMSKRLRLAKNLLSDKGVIFISIDDNEQANLRLLCDEVFGESNYMGDIIWQSRTSISNDDYISTNHNHTHIYAKSINSVFFDGEPLSSNDYINPDNDPRGPWKLVPIDANHPGGDTVYGIVNPKTGVEYFPPKNRIWAYNREGMQMLMNDGRIKFGLNDDSAPKKKLFYNERVAKGDTKTPSSLLLDAKTTKDGTNELIDILGTKKFDYPKPTAFINRLLMYCSKRQPNAIILDFFAGSGTTMHATMQMNKEDGGHRQCILVTNNENNICEEITYERNKRVMCGYTNAKGQQVEGLGGSMKYYKAAFVGEHNHEDAMDSDRIALAHNAGSLLALAENTLEEVKATEYYQIFKEKDGDIAANGNAVTAIYFTDDLEQFGEFVAEIDSIQQEQGYPHIAVYLFCWDSPEDYKEEFDDMRGLTLKAIPQPILDIYKRINS